jgi:hypothetical protein
MAGSTPKPTDRARAIAEATLARIEAIDPSRRTAKDLHAAERAQQIIDRAELKEAPKQQGDDELRDGEMSELARRLLSEPPRPKPAVEPFQPYRPPKPPEPPDAAPEQASEAPIASPAAEPAPERPDQLEAMIAEREHAKTLKAAHRERKPRCVDTLRRDTDDDGDSWALRVT